jgi:hypothetical protein
MMFYSACGYDQATRQQREKAKLRQSSNIPKDGDKDWSRRVPYEFTGCLAHVEITERRSDGEVTRITGHLEHNNSCHKAVLARLPAVPLHNHVYEVALSQLRDGARYG